MSVAGSSKSSLLRRTGVPLVIWRVRIGAVRQQRLHQVQTASQHRRMQRGVADRGGVRVRALVEQQDADRLRGRCGRPRTSALVPFGSASFTSAPAVEQDPRGLDVADARRKQQRRAASPRDGVVELFAARPLRHLAGDGLRVDARAGAHVRAVLDAAPATTSGCFCAAAHISAV